MLKGNAKQITAEDRLEVLEREHNAKNLVIDAGDEFAGWNY
jgi:hypothetical protein